MGRLGALIVVGEEGSELNRVPGVLGLPQPFDDQSHALTVQVSGGRSAWPSTPPLMDPGYQNAR
jgi:hypothetical protein